MARELIFQAKGKEYPANPTLIDRKKLYGWTENQAFDDQGNNCKLVSMDESGTLIIPKGGIGLGILSPEGKWIQRSKLKAVNMENEPVSLISSSYSIPIELKETVTYEEYLDHSITAFYQLENIDNELIEWIGDNIYRFDYCYRDSYEGKPAFLLVSEDADKNKQLFMMLGIPNNFEMLSITQSEVIIDETSEEEEDNEEIDFSMF